MKPRVLDLSANWGECLITAMAMDYSYVGFSNEQLRQKGYQQMITALGDPSLHQIYCQPFDQNLAGKADIIYYRPDIYNPALTSPNGLVTNSMTFEQWLVFTVFASLMQAWDCLVENVTLLVLPISDSKEYAFCEATNLFIEQFLKNSSHEGVIGLVDENRKPKAAWIWRKHRK